MRGINQRGVSEDAIASAHRLRALERGEVLELLESCPDCAWLKLATRPSSGAAFDVLGMFWLRIGKEALWPAVLIRVTFSGRSRVTALHIQTGQSSAYRTATRQGDVAPWAQWMGKADGEPSVLNGDEPRRERATPASTGADAESSQAE